MPFTHTSCNYERVPCYTIDIGTGGGVIFINSYKEVTSRNPHCLQNSIIYQP